jgi:hypothetical protein
MMSNDTPSLTRTILTLLSLYSKPLSVEMTPFNEF